MSNTLFIPSYNRPCQLFALLESIKKHDKCNFFSNIEIYYQGTTDRYFQAYGIVKNMLKNDSVTFVEKSGSHYMDVLASFDKNTDYWSITSDDSLFYRPFELTEDDLNSHFLTDVNHLSMRLGYNTTVIDYEHPEKKHYLDGQKVGKFVRFYWSNHSNHYGHPFGIDSFVTKLNYMKQLILRSCAPDHFNYRYFECKMCEYLKMNNNKPFALCLENSVLVNSCNNMVTENLYCKNGVQHSFTPEELNDRFLDGEKIDIDIKEEINSVQQELPFKFIKK